MNDLFPFRSDAKSSMLISTAGPRLTVTCNTETFISWQQTAQIHQSSHTAEDPSRNKEGALGTMLTTKRCVVVTGASSGIGLGTVRILVQAGFHVCGSVRRAADGERLCAEFGDAFTPLLFDVTDPAAVKKAADQVRELLGGHTLFGLVNNAGVAFHGPLMHQPISEFARNIEINLTGTLIVTQAFLPLLGADRTLTGPPGRIIMVSSTAGKFAAPFIGSYAASKHGLEGMSESLRRELMLFGIDVIIVGPGAVVTPIWDKAESHDLSAYEGTPYHDPLSKFTRLITDDGRSGHTPEHIGRSIQKALTTPRPAVRYAIVSNRFARWTLPLLLPPRWVDWLMANTLGLIYKKPSVLQRHMKEGQRCVMVTGASSGIGLGTVRVLIEAGYHVCGSVRKRGDGERLRAEFGSAFTPLLFDVTDIRAVRNAAEQVSEMLGGCTLFGLVNNAGVCFHGPLMYQPVPEFARNIEINLTGTLIVTQAFLPLLGADRTLTGPPGRIIMMSSQSGKMAPPFTGAYAASKHGLEGMSESLRRELMIFGIDVIIVGPGFVATPMWDKAEERGTVSGYEGTPYRDVGGKIFTWGIVEGRRGYTPERIGRCVLEALTAWWPPARYSPVANRLTMWTLPMLLPARWIDWILAFKFGLSYKQHVHENVKVD